MMSIIVRYLHRDEYDRAAEFLDTHWTKNHIFVLSKPLFDWSYDRADVWDQDSYSVAAGFDGEDVVGFMGAIPYVFNRYGKSELALWMTNWMVANTHRGMHLGSKLYEIFQRDPFKIITGFGLNERVAEIYRSWNWHVVDNIPRHVCFIKEFEEDSSSIITSVHLDLSASQVKQMVKFYTIDQNQFLCSDYDILARNELLKIWDDKGWNIFSRKSVGAARDAHYLKWRYLHHPIYRYNIISIKDDSGVGICIWRLEKIKTSIMNSKELSFARVVEFIPSSLGNAKALLFELTNVLKKSDINGFDYFGYHGVIGNWLISHGVKQIDDHPDGVFIPFLFQPLSSEKAQIRSMQSIDLPPPNYPLRLSCDWYWTKSDSDQDRPNRLPDV